MPHRVVSTAFGERRPDLIAANKAFLFFLFFLFFVFFIAVASNQPSRLFFGPQKAAIRTRTQGHTARQCMSSCRHVPKCDEVMTCPLPECRYR
jgi:hypothetical protein